LKRLEVKVTIVNDGAEILRHALGTKKFDVVMVDVQLPIIDGENVSKMIKSIQNINQNTPIIALTAYEKHSHYSEIFVDVLIKPVTRDTLVTILSPYVTECNGSSIRNSQIMS
jgi:CheY-like chemotaxis protein